MAISGSQKAYTSARAGLARSGATRSNYVFPDLFGFVSVGGANMTAKVKYGSLKVTQALNEQPDTCSFDVFITDAATQAALVVGADVVIGLGGPTDNVLFGGRILTVQTTRNPAHVASLRSVMCADYLQVLDSEYLITYDWPSQSATTTILDLIARFANKSGGVAISTAGVEAGLATHQAFGVTNEKFSTVLRRIVTGFPTGGGFYVDPLKVLRVWSGTSEPNQTNPTPLTLANPHLKQFAETVDGSQVRDAVIVEGLRTSAPIGLTASASEFPSSVPVEDASIIDKVYDQPGREVRIGSQRFTFRYAVANPWGGYPAGTPTTTRVRADVPWTAGVGQVVIPIDRANIFGARFSSWARVDDQVLAVLSYSDSNTPNVSTMTVPRQGWGGMTGPIPLGATVTTLDHLAGGETTHRYDVAGSPEQVREQIRDADVVMTVRSSTPPAIHEQIVQDGRYGKAGAAARGAREVADFSAPLTSIQFETTDLNAKPGRLVSYNFVEPPLAAMSGSYMILSAELTWPVWGELPRRTCYAAHVEAADVVDAWLVDRR